jgi:3-keto-disaccharide hydrolase
MATALNTMNRHARRLAICAALVSGLLLPMWCAAAEPQADADGWIVLFDGKTVNGWHKNPEKIGHGTGGRGSVEPGGVLAGEQDPPGSGNGGILLTDRKFGDFELSMEMMPNWGSDSGIFLRSTDKGQCIQMMVDYYNRGSVGHFYGEATGGWGARTFSLRGHEEDGKLVKLTTMGARPAKEVGLVESCTPEEWLKVWKIGDWNQALVRVEGGRFPVITTYINGLKVGVFDAASSTAEKYDREEVAKLLGERGSIALQVHGGDSYPPGARCRYRYIRIREL